MLEFLLNPNNLFFWIFIIIVIIIAITIVWWPFNIYIQFSYINAKLEAIGNQYLSEKELNRLIESKNLNDFKDSLNNSKDYDISGENSRDIQLSLDKNYINTIDEMKNDSSKKILNFYNIFYDMIDLEYLKKIIKNKLLNSEFEKFNVEEINNKRIKQLSNEIINSENEVINEILIKFGFNSNLKNLQYKSSSDYLFLDNIFDIYIISKFKDLKLPKRCKKAQENFVEYMIDIKNIKNILRAKNLDFDEKICDKIFLGNGKEISKWKFNELCQLKDVNQVIINLEGTSYYDTLKDSIEKFNTDKTTQVFEKSLDEHFIKILKDLSIENYVHIGPILRFLISKKFEIINLKIISKAIEENIDSQLIKNNLIMEINQ